MDTAVVGQSSAVVLLQECQHSIRGQHSLLSGFRPTRPGFFLPNCMLLNFEKNYSKSRFNYINILPFLSEVLLYTAVCVGGE